MTNELIEATTANVAAMVNRADANIDTMSQ
jgi:hypothetical protein